MKLFFILQYRILYKSSLWHMSTRIFLEKIKKLKLDSDIILNIAFENKERKGKKMEVPQSFTHHIPCTETKSGQTLGCIKSAGGTTAKQCSSSISSLRIRDTMFGTLIS